MLTGEKAIRLKGYDYFSPGGYFITQCTQYRRPILASIKTGKSVLTDPGAMVCYVWYSLEKRFSGCINLDAFVVMPDHIHGIIFIKESIPADDHPESVPADDRPESVPAALVAAGTVGLGTSPTPTGPTPTWFDQIKRPTLFDIVGAFKSISTVLYIRGVHDLGWDPFPKRLWQRMYYKHIIRNESELNRIRWYIINNPIKFCRRSGISKDTKRFVRSGTSPDPME